MKSPSLTSPAKAPKRSLRPPSARAKPHLLGAHVSTAGGVHMAVERALEVGCTAMQIFVKNNMQWFAGTPLGGLELETFHTRVGELGAVFGHSGYMINLSATNPEFLAKSRRALAEELLRADQLRLPFLVLHPGAHLGAGMEAGLDLVVQSLDAVFATIPKVQTQVALETTAGQGSCLGCEFEHLAYLLSRTREAERLCVCIDTAHLFASGYDLTTFAGTKKVFAQFDRIVGRRHLAALHLNDSKTARGSRVDRHEHIGEGQIGLEAFRYIMTSPRLACVPKVLETPKNKEMDEDRTNLATLRQLAEAPSGLVVTT